MTDEQRAERLRRRADRLGSPDGLDHDALAQIEELSRDEHYSTRTSSEYAELEQELDALRILRNDRAVADAATSAIRELATRADGYHQVPPPLTARARMAPRRAR